MSLLPQPGRAPLDSRPPQSRPEAPPATPLLHPLNASKEGVTIGDPIKFSTVIAAQPQPVCLVTFAVFLDPTMDVLPVETALDAVVRSLTQNFVILVRPGSPRNGNSLTQVANAIRRLSHRLDLTGRVYKPSDELVAFLGIGDNRNGLVNALHRFEEGRLIRAWIAPRATPTDDHRDGQSDVLRFRRK